MAENKSLRFQRGAMLGLVLVAACAWPAEPVSRYGNGVISLKAEETPLIDVFESMAMSMPLVVHSGLNLDGRVTIDVSDKPVDQVVRRLLRQQSYTFVHDGETGRYVLWVFASDAAARQPLIIGSGTEDESDNDAIAWNQATAGFLDADANVRVDALYTLADIDSTAATDLLRAALSDSESSVRTAAIELLGDSGATSVLTAGWWILPTSEQILVIDALGDIESRQSTAFLKVVAASDNAELAAAADQYLAERR